MVGIYKITNTINGKVYIGQSKNLKSRLRDHKNKPFYNNNEFDSPLHRAIRKYGLDNFFMETVEECLEEQLNEREIYWIKYYNSTDKTLGYNILTGGTQVTIYKLEDKVVDSIKNDLQNTLLTYQEIADKYQVSIGFISDYNNGNIRQDKNTIYPIREKKVFLSNRCVDCGAIVYRLSMRCAKCYGESRRMVERPSREELKKLIRQQTFVQIGQIYGVADNTIRKWCDSYSLPKTKHIIKSIPDMEWDEI